MSLWLNGKYWDSPLKLEGCSEDYLERFRLNEESDILFLGHHTSSCVNKGLENGRVIMGQGEERQWSSLYQLRGMVAACGSLRG